ncbi:MAG: Putative bifunctional phosphatase/peptidyl-prolyl cis-trans isomerase [Parabacteroides sp.]
MIALTSKVTIFVAIIQKIKMKMKKLFAVCFVALLGLISFHLQAQEVEMQVLIDTDMGKIKVKLFNDTPLHRDNFIKNVKEHRYDGLLFHRVIKQFMIQAGDINSKDAPIEQHLGDGDPDYTIPAEIVFPKYFHKRGMLCAARVGDDENPERASSATQFYIVTGKFFTEMELDKMEKEQGITFTPEQRQAYMLEGGTPHLDNKYTIFGEVVKGIKVVDKIQFTETNADDRPTKNIKIKTMTIVTK